jgi:rod shape-determining protein MreC
MTITRRARELALVVMLLALVVLTLRANIKSPADLNLLDRAILRISAPLQALVSGAARGVAGAWSRYVFLVGVEAKNARLIEENARLKSALERESKRSLRVTELERLAGLKSEVGMQAQAARVIGAETSSFFRVVRVRLDRGEESVRPGLAVVAPAGVVGRVQRVFGGYSDVLLACDPKSSIDIVVPRTGGRGVLKGIPGDNRYRTRIEYLLRKDEVKEGDLIVTSGLGGMFPRDYPVGKIVSVTRRDFGLYQEAEVEPAVDFARLSEVLVLAPKDAHQPQ